MNKKPKQKTKRATSSRPKKVKDPLQNIKLTNGKSYEEDIDEALELRLQVLYKPDSKLLEDTRKYVQWIE